MMSDKHTKSLLITCNLFVFAWCSSLFVMLPNSKTSSNWRRTCHVPLVKTHLLLRAKETH